MSPLPTPIDGWPSPSPNEAADIEGVGRPATIAERGIARFTDLCLMVLLILLLARAGGAKVIEGGAADGTDAAEIASWYLPVILVILYLYETLPIGARGQTIGKRLMRIQVVASTTGQPPSYFRAGSRFMVGLLAVAIGLVFGWLGGLIAYAAVYLSALRGGPLRRNLPDRVADTLVIRRN